MSLTTQRRSALWDWPESRAVKMGVAAVVTLITGWFLLVNLETYPTISGWDEGMYLDFSMNLAYSGEYATLNYDMFERLIPCGGTGPTLVAPIALALRMSNNSLVAARLVMIAYFAAALVGAYLVVCASESWVAAIISVPLLLASGYQIYDALWIGRQVLAELPALAFLLLGVWAWYRSWHGSWHWLALSMLLLGLSVMTKNQLLWVLVAGFGFFVLADLVYYRKLGWARRLAPAAGVLLGYGLWFAATLWILGPEQQASYLKCQSDLGVASFLRISPDRWFENVKFFLRAELWFVAVVAMGYALLRARYRSEEGLQRLVLPVLTGLSLAVSLLALPWARYLFFPLALAALCTAILIQDIVGWAQKRWSLQTCWAAVLLIGIIAVLTGPRLIQNVGRILGTNDPSPQVFASQIDRLVPSEERVLNWEWEIEFYTTRNFAHPPYILFPAMIDSAYSKVYNPMLDEPRIPLDVRYVVVGPFATDVQAFTRDLDNREHEVIVEQGPYKLYKLS